MFVRVKVRMEKSLFTNVRTQIFVRTEVRIEAEREKEREYVCVCVYLPSSGLREGSNLMVSHLCITYLVSS